MALWVLLRFTLRSDRNSPIRNRVASRFSEIGFGNTGAGLWEGEVPDEAKGAKAVGSVGKLLGQPRRSGSLSDLWVYLDPKVEKTARKHE